MEQFFADIYMRIIASWIARSQALRVVALSLSYAISLLIFQRGLLVKRQVLPHKSSCLDSVISLPPDICWLPPRYNKTILLIIDALRYDFIYPYENEKKKKKVPLNPYHQGQLLNVARLLREQPRNAALFPFLADAPTTTFQRIKALVTGSVPAFIEAGDNFGGTEITEDNIVDQLVARGRNATLLGDETWVQLLPGRFHRHFEEPSFDIKDLDTVDNTVIAHIFEELLRPDWTLMIAHCLGVDHAGHRYGPSHSEMRRKLHQMDHLVGDLAKRLPEDTLLLVLGDHGMTPSGDHGGNSDAERLSALFAYTKRADGLAGTPFDSATTNNGGGPAECRETKREDTMVYYQVDLVPTLALLLDLPIPFSNIGTLIDPIFTGCGNASSTVLNQALLREIRFTSFQMLRYAKKYVQHQPELRDQLHQIVRQHESSSDDYESNVQTISSLRSMIRHSLDRQFQWTICLLGLLSLFDSIIFNCYLLVTGTDEWLSVCLWIFRSALFLLQLSLVLAQQLGSDQILFTLASLTISLGYQLPVFIAKLIPICRQHFRPSLLIILAAQLALSLCPFSNSFIIYESDVLRYAIQSLVLLTAWRIIHLYRITSLWRRIPQDLSDLLQYAMLICLILRFIKDYESCREEQVECVPFKMGESQLFTLCILISFGSCYLLLSQIWQASPVTKLFVWPMTVLLCVHWLFDLTVHSMQGQQLGQSSSSANTIAMLEFWSRCLAQLIFICLFVHQIVICRLNNSNTITSILDIQRNESMTKGSLNARWFESQFQVLSVPLMALVGAKYGSSMALMLAIYPMSEQLFRAEHIWTWSWLLHLLGGYTFYATGNQATLDAIPWRAAFVLLPGNFPYKAASGFLILTAMFSGRLLASLMAQRKAGIEDEQASLYLLLFGALKVFGCSTASLLHRHHLMFYKVFAPKFVFDGVEFLYCCAFVTFWICLFKLGGFGRTHYCLSTTFTSSQNLHSNNNKA